MLSYQVRPTDSGFICLFVEMKDVGVVEINLSGFFKEEHFITTLYSQADMYVKTLNPTTQLEIFQIFHDTAVKEDSQSYGENYVVKELEQKLKRLVELFDYERWKVWFRQFKPLLPIPDTVKDTFKYDPDTGTTSEKTYITDEYVDLAGLILFIRMLSPNYIEYFNYCRQVSSHPFYLLFRLFVDSQIQDCPEVEKLRQYIEANQQTLIGTSKNEHLIITAGLSDDDALDYLVAEVIFNKLLTIDFFNKKCNIVSYIFQTIKYKGGFATNESQSIRTISNRGDTGREDHSYFEDYRKTSTVAVGTFVEIQESLSDPVYLANDLGYTNFDFDTYNKELNTVGLLLKQPPDNLQIYLLGWFLSRAVNPRALFYIEKRKIAELRIFAKVALMNTRHSFIGALICSVKQTGLNYANVVIIRNTLNKDLLKRLKRHYKFAMEDDKQSVVEKTFLEVGREITNNIWLPIGDPEQYKGITTAEGYLEVPSNINDVVCGYVDFALDKEHNQTEEFVNV